MFGSIDSYDSVARQLAVATDSLVVSVGYRQPPLHPFPVPLQDCIAAVKWVKRSIASHNGAYSADDTLHNSAVQPCSSLQVS